MNLRNRSESPVTKFSEFATTKKNLEAHLSQFRSELPLREINYEAAAPKSHSSNLNKTSTERQDQANIQNFQANEEISRLKEVIDSLSEELSEAKMALTRAKEENKMLKKLKKLNENEHNIDQENLQVLVQKWEEDKIKLTAIIKKLERKLHKERAKNQELLELLENNETEFLQQTANLHSTKEKKHSKKKDSPSQQKIYSQIKEIDEKIKLKKQEFDRLNNLSLSEETDEIGEINDEDNEQQDFDEPHPLHLKVMP